MSQNSNDTNAMWKTIRLCIPKKSVSVRVYSDDDKTILLIDLVNFF